MIPFLFSGNLSSRSLPTTEEQKEQTAMIVYHQQQTQDGWIKQCRNSVANRATQQYEYWWPAPTPPKSTTAFSNTNRLDPEVFGSACKILGIAEQDANNIPLVQEKYERIIRSLEERQGRVSGPSAAQFQLLINDARAAYITLTQAKESKDQSI